MLCEMQSVSSRIWTRVTESISCEDNHYTTGTQHYKVRIRGKWSNPGKVAIEKGALSSLLTTVGQITYDL